MALTYNSVVLYESVSLKAFFPIDETFFPIVTLFALFQSNALSAIVVTLSVITIELTFTPANAHLPGSSTAGEC